MRMNKIVELMLNILKTYNPGRQTMNQHALAQIDAFRVETKKIVSPKTKKRKTLSQAKHSTSLKQFSTS